MYMLAHVFHTFNYKILVLLFQIFRLVQHWVECMKFFIYNICGFNECDYVYNNHPHCIHDVSDITMSTPCIVWDNIVKLIWPPNTELCHILSVRAMWPCDHALLPFDTKMGHVIMTMWCACFEVLAFVFLKYKIPYCADFMVLLLGNQRCHVNHFVLH